MLPLTNKLYFYFFSASFSVAAHDVMYYSADINGLLTVIVVFFHNNHHVFNIYSHNLYIYFLHIGALKQH